MEITAWDVYWVTRLDQIKCALYILMVCTAMLGGLGLLFFTISEGSLRAGKWFAAWLLPLAAALLIVQAFVPSTRSAAAMVVLPAIINSEAVQTLPAEITQLAKEWLQELRPAKEY